jgi:predicted nicotinamide N-methyase
MRLLSDRALLPLWLGRFTAKAGEWLFLLTALVAAWNGTLDAADVAWVLAALLIPRLLVVVALESWLRTLPPRASALAPALAGVVAIVVGFAVSQGSVAIDQALMGGAAAIGFLAAVAGERRARTLRASVELTRLGVAALADALVDRVALLAAALAAVVVLYGLGLSVSIVFTAAGVLLLGAALLESAATRRTTDVAMAAMPPIPDDLDTRPIARRTALYVVAAFTSGALGAVLLIVAPLLGLGGNDSAAFGPALVAAAAIGMLLGPLPIPRLLLRLPAPAILVGAVLITTLAAIALVATKSTLVGLIAFFLFGLASVTMDALRATALRRLVPPVLYARTSRLSRLALTVGQVYGAIGIVTTSPADPFAVLGLLAISQVVLVGLALLLGGFRSSLKVGGFSSLPVKSVVHKLSWATRPEAMPQDLARLEPRGRKLATWINRQATMERLTVTLPRSEREYEIYRPDEASRERLFEQGRADPDKQMPYWAKVWPSGVALADVVVEKKEQVAGQHVLELGAGLGVTACTVLEYGGDLMTADYSALPLAHCRLNTVVNTGKAPRATCFNWRHDSEIVAATSQPQFADGFPLIIAGDVLYEGRDAEPLLNVIDRLLVADGSLWLAEPVRRTAQRFLDEAATLGWDIESRQVTADWPDATNGPVNLHFLRRSAEPDRVLADLGGWRI